MLDTKTSIQFSHTFAHGLWLLIFIYHFNYCILELYSLIQIISNLNALLPLDKSKPQGVLDSKKDAVIPREGNNQHIAAHTFTFRELAAATKNFRQDCLLGEGGFGRVYKGRLDNGQVWLSENLHAFKFLNLPFRLIFEFLISLSLKHQYDRHIFNLGLRFLVIWSRWVIGEDIFVTTPYCVQAVAVKQLDRNGLQGNREFLVEVLMLSLLHHDNLVNLIGYCADGDQRLLVYEFMPLGSLEDHLHGKFTSLINISAIVYNLQTAPFPIYSKALGAQLGNSRAHSVFPRRWIRRLPRLFNGE
jgi:hypothetical protein